MSDNYKVVFITGFPQEAIDAVLTYQPEGFSTTVLRSRETSEDDQVEALRDADFLILYGGRPSEKAFRAATRLRLVQLLAAGYDAMDLDLLSELEIPCANNGGANSWSVADHAVLLMLSVYKLLPQTYNSVREARWRGPINTINTFEMANKLVGIIGLGNIGRRVAQRVPGVRRESAVLRQVSASAGARTRAQCLARLPRRAIPDVGHSHLPHQPDVRDVPRRQP